MKKLIIICSLMLIIVGLSVAECIVSTKVYEEMFNEMMTLEREIDENEYALKNSKAHTHAKEIVKKWKGYRDYVMATANHAIARTLDEKIEAMLSSIETGEYVNAKEYVSLSSALLSDLIDETHPNIANLL